MHKDSDMNKFTELHVTGLASTKSVSSTRHAGTACRGSEVERYIKVVQSYCLLMKFLIAAS